MCGSDCRVCLCGSNSDEPRKLVRRDATAVRAWSSTWAVDNNDDDDIDCNMCWRAHTHTHTYGTCALAHSHISSRLRAYSWSTTRFRACLTIRTSQLCACTICIQCVRTPHTSVHFGALHCTANTHPTTTTITTTHTRRLTGADTSTIYSRIISGKSKTINRIYGGMQWGAVWCGATMWVCSIAVCAAQRSYCVVTFTKRSHADTLALTSALCHCISVMHYGVVYWTIFARSIAFGTFAENARVHVLAS